MPQNEVTRVLWAIEDRAGKSFPREYPKYIRCMATRLYCAKLPSDVCRRCLVFSHLPYFIYITTIISSIRPCAGMCDVNVYRVLPAGLPHILSSCSTQYLCLVIVQTIAEVKQLKPKLCVCAHHIYKFQLTKSLFVRGRKVAGTHTRGASSQHINVVCQGGCKLSPRFIHARRIHVTHLAATSSAHPTPI